MVSGSAADTPFGYAGQYTDAETGFQYLRARSYDPATGQFLTRDPLANLTNMPYAYTADNPLNGTDPSGLLFGVCDTGPANCLGSAGNALGGVSQAVFRQTGNALGAAGQFAWQHGGRDLARTTLEALNNFDNTSFVNEVALNTVNFAQSVVNTPAALQNEWTVAQWVANHPREALQNADTRIKQDFGVALAEGQCVWNYPNDTYTATQQALSGSVVKVRRIRYAGTHVPPHLNH